MSRIQANLLLLLTAMIWGSTFVVQQVGTGNLEAITFTGARFLLGALVVFPLAFLEFKKKQKIHHPISTINVLGMVLTGVVLFLAAATQQQGIFFTSVANAGFLTALYVPLVPLLAATVLKAPIHWITWPAACACLIGTYIMSGAGTVHLSSGDIWVVGSAFFWAIHVLLVGQMATRTQSPLIVACLQFFTVGILGLFFGAFFERPHITDFSGATLGIVYAGVLSAGIAFTLQVVAQRFSPAADCAILLSGETVFSALFAFIFLGDIPSSRQIEGALLILAGILAVQLFPLLHPPKESGTS